MSQASKNHGTIISALNNATGSGFERKETTYETGNINRDTANAIANTLRSHTPATVTLDENKDANEKVPQRDRRANVTIDAKSIETTQALGALQNKAQEIGAAITTGVHIATSQFGCGARR